ncbi:MAG: 50S ribosomal protein L17 [Spirochaetes bacterium]|nr:50S ribosomal protein L17 [Spirochaetota bacterium]
MRHRKAVPKLGRTSAHRKAMLKNMAVSLINKEKIKTTKKKAKVLSSYIEKLITRAKKNTLHNIRVAARKVQDRKALIKLFDNIAPRYQNRPGGYTRIYTLGLRAGDAAEMAIIELVEEELTLKVKSKKKKETSVEKEKKITDNVKKDAKEESADKDAKEESVEKDTKEKSADKDSDIEVKDDTNKKEESKDQKDEVSDKKEEPKKKDKK